MKFVRTSDVENRTLNHVYHVNVSKALAMTEMHP